MGGGPIPTIAAPERAQGFVDARIDEGSDYIKIIHGDGSTWAWTTQRVPMLDNATMRATWWAMPSPRFHALISARISPVMTDDRARKM
jgi:hypothetical protein